MSNSNWYETEDWYAPLKQPEPQEKEAPAAPAKKKRRKPWASALAIFLVLALMIGSAVAFRGLPKTANITPPKITVPPTLPAEPEKPVETEEPEEPEEDIFPDDWMEFFENYYTKTETPSGTVNIPKEKSSVSFSLVLQKSEDEELSLQKLYEKCAPSIVAITGYQNGKVGYFWGTGVVLSEDGLILTNTHVVEDCDRAIVTLSNDEEYEAKLIGADSISDLALLKINVAGLTPAEFGESDSLSVGDRVAAIGNPLGETFRSTLTDGVISAIARDINYKGRSMNLLQTNAALNEGNSGGALFNMYGQVIGITNMKMMSSYSSIEGIGFAIPSSTVREVVNSLVAYGEVKGRPSIGITVGAIPEEAMAQYGLPEGLYISDVVKNSDAYAKGIRVGDVLTQINHIPVTTTAEVLAIKESLQVGDTMLFTIWRDGKTMEVEVALMDTNDIYG